MLLLTGLAPALGPRLSGLLATFPVYAAILAVFAHHLAGPAPAIQVLRGLLLGLFAVAGFFVVLGVLIERVAVRGDEEGAPPRWRGPRPTPFLPATLPARPPSQTGTSSGRQRGGASLVGAALWADSHQLHQVVVNLITNANQAMQESAPPRWLTLTTRSVAEGRQFILEVADTGPGISPDIQMRLFEPFFTTKPVGQGTGLGLAMCQGIVEGHGGAIRVESAPGQGATFVVELPVQLPAVQESEAPTGELPPRRRGGASSWWTTSRSLAGCWRRSSRRRAIRWTWRSTVPKRSPSWERRPTTR